MEEKRGLAREREDGDSGGHQVAQFPLHPRAGREASAAETRRGRWRSGGPEFATGSVASGG